MEVLDPEETILDAKTEFMMNLFQSAAAFWSQRLCLKDQQGNDKYTNMCEYLVDAYASTPDELCQKLQQLYDKCLTVGTVAAPAETPVTTIPNTTMDVPAKFVLGLWSIGYSPDHAVKGPSPTHAILEVAKTSLINGGSQTSRYPIDIIWNLGDQKAAPGDPIAHHSAIIKVGFSVVLGSYFLAIACSELNWLDPGHLPEEHRVHVAKTILEALHLHCMSLPKASLQDEVADTIHQKFKAADRNRPNSLQLHFA